MKRGMKYRLKLTPSQEAGLRQMTGAVRFVWNAVLAARKDAYERGEKWGLKEMRAHLYMMRELPETSWLKDLPAAVIDEALRQMDDAYKRFFKGLGGPPVFKKYGRGAGVKYYAGSFKLSDGKLILSKMLKSPIKVIWHRPLPESVQPSQVTVSVDAAGRWFASFLVDDPRTQPLPELDNKVSIHLGVNRHVVTSDGEEFNNPRPLEKALKRIKKQAQSLSRKVKGSSNYEKVRKKLAKTHAKVADIRRDHGHKTTRSLVNRYQLLRIEQWAVQNMLKKGHRAVARGLYDSAFHQFWTMLEYKAAWAGRVVEKIERFTPTSKKCSACGQLNDPKAKKTWKCSNCKKKHDREVNAVTNVSLSQ